jgi:uncharacterized protein YcbK (DUF882 family)
MVAVAEFQDLLDRAGVRHFTAREVFFRGASDSKLKLNTDPPRCYWFDLLQVVRIADTARGRLARPVRILSAYRAPVYNKAIGGASQSTHMKGQALDLATTSPATLATLHRVLCEMRAGGHFKGGIGLYKTFVHVDVRGTNASWSG